MDNEREPPTTHSLLISWILWVSNGAGVLILLELDGLGRFMTNWGRWCAGRTSYFINRTNCFECALSNDYYLTYASKHAPAGLSLFATMVDLTPIMLMIFLWITALISMTNLAYKDTDNTTPPDSNKTQNTPNTVPNSHLCCGLLEFASQFVPDRISKEDIGDTLEVIDFLQRSRAPEWRIWVHGCTALFWIAANSIWLTAMHAWRSSRRT